VDVLAEFFRHNSMMNTRILEACRALTPEQLGASVDGTFGSVVATLAHIANGQMNYSRRLLDLEPVDGLSLDPPPALDAIADLMSLGDRRLEQAAARGDQDRMVRVMDDDMGELELPVSLLLLQAINHGTEHRAHIATILTQLGVEPPDMDGWTYFLESGQMRAVDPAGA
jgi:uncharacterized damage-inducible protein DinB